MEWCGVSRFQPNTYTKFGCVSIFRDSPASLLCKSPLHTLPLRPDDWKVPHPHGNAAWRSLWDGAEGSAAGWKNSATVLERVGVRTREMYSNEWSTDKTTCVLGIQITLWESGIWVITKRNIRHFIGDLTATLAIGQAIRITMIILLKRPVLGASICDAICR